MIDKKTRDLIESNGFTYNGENGRVSLFSKGKIVLSICTPCNSFRVNDLRMNTYNGVHNSVVKYFEKKEMTFCEKVKKLFA